MSRSSERGATAIIVAIVLTVLLGFAALSLETGHVLSVRGELQNGADAAALAGAKRLNGTNDDYELAGARTDARSFARANPTDRYDVEPFTIQLGYWAPPAEACSEVGGVQVGETGPDDHKFCRIDGESDADAANITAVRVVTNRQGAPGGTGGGAVDHPFGAFVGKAQTEVSAEAIAVSGGPCNEGCPELPFAVKASCVEDSGGAACGGGSKLFFVGLAHSGVDSAGMTIFKEASCGSDTGTDTKHNGSSGWGTGSVCDILADKCENHPVVGKCISIKNGDNVVGNCSSLGDKICNLLQEKVGDVAQIPLVEYSPGEDCSGGFGDFNYNHAAKIVSIGSVRLVGAQCMTGQNKGIVALPGYEQEVAKCDFANGSCFVLEFVCDQVDDDVTAGGCRFAGTAVAQPVLVR